MRRQFNIFSRRYLVSCAAALSVTLTFLYHLLSKLERFKLTKPTVRASTNNLHTVLLLWVMGLNKKELKRQRTCEMIA